MQKEGLLIILSGPSGTGKGAICSALLKDKKNIQLSISCTTRKPRHGEDEGVNYFFKTESEFIAMIEEGKLLEYAKVFDNYYGTPFDYVKDKLKDGYDVLLEIDVQGAMKVKEKYSEGVLIFVRSGDNVTIAGIDKYAIVPCLEVGRVSYLTVVQGIRICRVARGVNPITLGYDIFAVLYLS
jgi:guanylate kinase